MAGLLERMDGAAGLAAAGGRSELPASASEVSAEFQKMDTDGDGKIQFEEFAHWLGVPAASCSSASCGSGGGGPAPPGVLGVLTATASGASSSSSSSGGGQPQPPRPQQLDILLETGSPPDTGPVAAGLWAAAFLTSWERSSLTSHHVRLLPPAGSYGLAHELPQGWFLADAEHGARRAAAVGLAVLDASALPPCKWKVGGPQKYRGGGGGQSFDSGEPVEVRYANPKAGSCSEAYQSVRVTLYSAVAPGPNGDGVVESAAKLVHVHRARRKGRQAKKRAPSNEAPTDAKRQRGSPAESSSPTATPTALAVLSV